MVLWALPETDVINTWLQPGVTSADVNEPFQRLPESKVLFSLENAVETACFQLGLKHRSEDRC